MKIVRTLVSSALAVLLLVAGAALGLYASARYAPDRVAGLAERLLAERLGPVRVGSVRPAFAWGPAIEAREVRTVEPAAEGAELAVERVRIGF
ncbi:MAG TPA: hypothetical protein VLC53_17500, partial [Myxococcota bacterium]|nr:hypothetical protein [Myxococcota bacterium]